MITTCKRLETGNEVYATVLTEKDPPEIVMEDRGGRMRRCLAQRDVADATCLYTEKPSADDKKVAEERVMACLADANWKGGVEFTHKKRSVQ